MVDIEIAREWLGKADEENLPIKRPLIRGTS
jgi:hypothetical protein